MFRKTSIIKILSICVMLSIVIGMLAGCTDDPLPAVDIPLPSLSVTEKPPPALGASEFAVFINELFVEDATSDSISLNYFVADPSSFGINSIVPTLGEVATPETIRRDRDKNRENEEKLKEFEYDLLDPEQQVIYDILARSFNIFGSISDRDDFAYYMGYIRPLNGIQIQLPILLAEFNFRSIADFDIYFALLEDTLRYFTEIIEFERERSRRGVFLSSENVDKVLEHIESFTANRDDNLMVLVFNDIVDEYDGLSEQQREQFKQRNQELVLEFFLPAYDALAVAMTELRGIGANTGGLSNLPDGRLYAEAYLQYRTDSDKTIDEMDAMLRRGMDDIQKKLVSIATNAPQLMEMFFDGMLGDFANDTPDNYMAMLSKAIAKDFPPLGPINYSIRTVHESLQEHVSPAFYLVPAVDSYYDNVIYINPADNENNLLLFTTLAHEGFPGHMYQKVYYLQQSPHPIRSLLTGIGYTEGWATYSEMQSHFYAGFDEDEAALLQMSRVYDLLLLSRIDLGVNGLDWDIPRLTRFLRDFGIDDQDVIEELYYAVAGVPLNYLPYSIGYLELTSLRDEATLELRDNFVPLDFHRFILDFGPAPFTLLGEHMREWIASGQIIVNQTVVIAPAA